MAKTRTVKTVVVELQPARGKHPPTRILFCDSRACVNEGTTRRGHNGQAGQLQRLPYRDLKNEVCSGCGVPMSWC